MTSKRPMGSLVFRSASSLLLAALFCGAAGISAQMPVFSDPSHKAADNGLKAPPFDVASVKENKSDGHMMRIMTKPDGFSCSNISLKTLIGYAYGIKQDLISGGPGWADSTGFDVDAKVAGPDVEVLKKLTSQQRGAMLQSLLTERFQLKVHTETKTLPIYELVAAKNGPKLTEFKLPAVAPKDPPDPKAPDAKISGRMMMGPGEFNGTGITLAALANNLSYTVHRTVIDKTGLTGKYDITLKWAPEEEGPGSTATDAGPSIFTAVEEQLGLRLQSTKGPVETLVIDHAAMPSEN